MPHCAAVLDNFEIIIPDSSVPPQARRASFVQPGVTRAYMISIPRIQVC
jgi:hypothetical protein